MVQRGRAMTQSGDTITKATHLLQMGQWREAEILFRQILEQNPNNAPALSGLGIIACQSGQLETGVQLFRSAAEIQPNQLAYLGQLARALVALQHFAEAADVCRRALNIDPHY